MSFIPQAMSGREIQHDIKFSNDGAISGIVSGIQSITLSDNSQLLLGGSAGANEFVMSSDLISVDPGGADRDLKLPAALGDLTLVGRTIKIFNSADAAGELITLKDFAGSIICFVGLGDVVEILISSHDASTGAVEAVLLTKTFSHTASGQEGSGFTILPAFTGKSYAVQYIQFTIPDGGNAVTLANDVTVTVDGVNLILTGTTVALSSTVPEGFYPAEADKISAGTTVLYAPGATSGTDLINIKIVYSLV
tara:strand:- start:4217 stop:4969 length:753 start_codon:yes stop_codon:yes gene_type:complete